MTRFTAGARVRARAADPDGHTRLPRYARGHIGEVVEVRAAWPLPDDAVRGVFALSRSMRCASPRPRCGVRGLHSVIIDMWESYLEEAP